MDWSNPTVQGATIAVVGVLIAALAGFAGAVLGAWIAARAQRSSAALAQTEAQADRLEARKARLDERTVSLASTALAASERHKREVGVQMRAWRRAARERLNPDGVIPDVHRADDVLDAVGGLYMVASQETADAGSRLYYAMLFGLDPLVYNAEEHRQGDVVTDPDYLVFNRAFLAYDDRKVEFINAVRVELGRPPLASSAKPFADGYGEDKPDST